MLKSVGFVGALGMAMVLLSSCGGDGQTSAPSGFAGESAEGVNVVAEDIAFSKAAYASDAGPIDFSFDNEGSIKHTLVVEGVDDFKLTVNARGDQDHGTVDLAPGEYTIFCDVPGHRQAGMEAALTVS